jgi:hypothetical protein
MRSFIISVHAVLMEIAMIAEAEEIELEALAFHHPYIWNIAYSYFSEIRLPGYRA